MPSLQSKKELGLSVNRENVVGHSKGVGWPDMTWIPVTTRTLRGALKSLSFILSSEERKSTHESEAGMCLEPNDL